jgi:dihydrofolate reductase
MAKLVLYMSMSLDGFIAGPADDEKNPLGINGNRLHQWFPAGGEDPRSYRPANEPSRTVFDELLATGAVVSGRRTAELAGYWGGDHHDGVPVFVPTRHPAEPREGIRFVTEGIESCVAQAKNAAGDRDVLLHGAYTARECLRAGVLDELEIHLVPVLLGEGRRLFDELGTEHVELDLVRTLQAPDVLHLRYRVRQP